MTHSPDGDWFWTGNAWVPARSPDRAWWWDGSSWVPSGATPRAVRYRYEPTAWTGRLQLIILALLVFGIVVAVPLLPSMNSIFQQSIDRSFAEQPAMDPAAAAQFRQTMTATLNAVLIFSGVLTAVFYVVILVGIWKLWRWLYWYLVVTGLLAGIGLIQNLVYVTGVVPYPFPSWFILPGMLSGLAWLALAICMIVLYRRVGTWARRRVPVSDGPDSNLS
jgi:hypothetical protein